MAEETLSQAAIDALLSGNDSPEPAKAAVPPQQEAPPPVPEPPPLQPEPVADPTPVTESPPTDVPEPKASPEQPQMRETAPVSEPVPEPIPTPEPVTPSVPTTSPPAAAAKSQVDMDAMTSRIRNAEESLAKLNSQIGQDIGFTNRLEALENSVLAICQMQQDSAIDPVIAKVPQLEKKLEAKLPELERELNKMSAIVNDLKDQLQTALNQIHETSKKVDNSSRGLKRTWGYDLQQNYECERCGSQGMVVGLVKCSECGDEDWWGWWPPDYENEMEPVKPSVKEEDRHRSKR